MSFNLKLELASCLMPSCPGQIIAWQPPCVVPYQYTLMKLSMLSIVLAALVLAPWSGCAPRTPPVELPPHKISYQGKHLKSDKGRIRILVWETIDMAAYPHLKLRDGFSLKRAVCRRSGGDPQGYAVAIHDASNRGFALEPPEDVQGTQGGFLFAPIESADQAREYAEFMVHETPWSLYDREHRSIYTQADFETALSQLDGSRTKTLQTPPTNITRVKDLGNGVYMVELVYGCEMYVRRLEYICCVVLRDGTLDLREWYVFMEGGPGAVF